MIDGWFKTHIDPLWESVAKPIASHGVTANQVTVAGLVLITCNSALYCWHHSSLIFGCTLAVCFATDALDGAVSRLRGEASLSGGYLDGMCDRYQELIVLFTISFVSGAWVASFLALSGSFLTSYAKARTAIEVRIDNAAWPDMFERLERIIFICSALVIDGLVSSWLGTNVVIAVALYLLALLTHVTAVQRMRRAFQLLKQADLRVRLAS